MGENKKLSLSFRFLRAIGLNFPEQEYGQVSLWDVISRAAKTYRDAFLLKHFMNCSLLAPLNPRMVRPWVLRKIGCHVGKDVFIGSDVWIDTGHANLITIDDHAHLTGRTVLLCHKKDLSDYCVGDDYAAQRYITAPIHLCKGCSTGTATIVLPGVTIGEGAIVGAGSIVTKNIPAWTIALGRPAKVVREIPRKKPNDGFDEITINKNETK